MKPTRENLLRKKIILEPKAKFMNPQHDPTMSATAARAAISGERVATTVTFAITGDTETDFIAAIMACFYSIPAPNPGAPNVIGYDYHAMAYRVCEYLSGRFKAFSDEMKAEREIQRQRAMAGWQTSPMPTPPPSQVYPWQTTDGTGLGSVSKSPIANTPSEPWAKTEITGPLFTEAQYRAFHSALNEFGIDRQDSEKIEATASAKLRNEQLADMLRRAKDLQNAAQSGWPEDGSVMKGP